MIKVYLKNETKSSIQDYIDKDEKFDNKRKINLKLNKSRSALFVGLNRYEIMDRNNLESLDINNEDKQNINKCIINNQINSKDLDKKHKMNSFHSNENIKKHTERNIYQNKN